MIQFQNKLPRLKHKKEMFKTFYEISLINFILFNLFDSV